MCPNSCIAYTGPFAALDKCPYEECGEPRYDQVKLRHGVRMARAKFWTIPLGPYLQSLWRNPETAKEMKYRRGCDEKIHQRSTVTPDQWDDIFDGSDYVKLVRDGVIKPTDMVLMFSIDEGLPIWDSSADPASADAFFIARLFLFLSTADGPGQQHMSGSNGHTARIACRFFCGIVGRHRFQAPHYYPALLKPSNSQYGEAEKPDVDIKKDLRSSLSSVASIQQSHAAMTLLLGSRNATDYKARQTEAGFGKPSILSGLPRCLGAPGVFPADLMHYVLNIGDLLSGLWTGKLDKLRPKIDNVARPIANAAELEALKVYLSSKWDTPFDETRDNARITRCSRLVLPEIGQTARSRWGESEKNRVTRMVKFESLLPERCEIGEVQYFFRYEVQDRTPTALAMVSVFGIPDRALLAESFGVLWVAHKGEAGMRVIPAKSISSVVAMIPFPLNRGVSREAEAKFRNGRELGSFSHPSLLQQSFLGSSRSSYPYGAVPLPSAHPRSSWSSSSMASLSRTSSPSIEMQALPDDDSLSSPSSPHPGFQGFSSPTASGYGHNSGPTTVDGLARTVETSWREIKGLKTTLRTIQSSIAELLDAQRNPRDPKEAVWIRDAFNAYNDQLRIAPMSAELQDLKDRYPSITIWSPDDYTSRNDAAPRNKTSKSGGGRDKKNDINNSGRYLEYGYSGIIGGHELGAIHEELNALLNDVYAAGKATARLSGLGSQVRCAVIFMLERRFPYLTLCPDHWKAKKVLAARYRYWAGKKHLVGANDASDDDSDDEVKTGSKRKRSTVSQPRKRQPPATDPAADPSLLRLSPAPVNENVDRPAPAASGAASADVPPVLPCPVSPVSRFPSSRFPASRFAASGRAGVDVPPPTPAPASTTATTTLPATLPVTTAVPKVSGKSCTPSATTFTARNLCMAVWCDDVGGLTSVFTAHWAVVQKDKALFTAYEAYARDMKKKKPPLTSIPDAATIRQAVCDGYGDFWHQVIMNSAYSAVFRSPQSAAAQPP
ncbi:hypothetical protein C8F01DRAFT_1091141 [Mycena amicta]|nr:hypothetical protein C8F01DRAFT_1091141 [Mycena amicta]